MQSASPIVIDGKGHLLGRLASIVAKQLLNGQVRTQNRTATTLGTSERELTRPRWSAPAEGRRRPLRGDQLLGLVLPRQGQPRARFQSTRHTLQRGRACTDGSREAEDGRERGRERFAGAGLAGRERAGNGGQGGEGREKGYSSRAGATRMGQSVAGTRDAGAAVGHEEQHE